MPERPERCNRVIGSLIRRYRQRKRISQTGLGIKIGIPETQAQQYIYKYEKGIISIPAHRLILIAKVLKIPLCRLYPKAEGLYCTMPLLKWQETSLSKPPVGDPSTRLIPFNTCDPGAFAVCLDSDYLPPRFKKGDKVVVSPGAALASGDFVLAVYDDQTLLRKIKFYPDFLLLLEPGGGFDELLVQKSEEDRLKIVGKVIGRLELY